MIFKYDPEKCPNHPPASQLKALWCADCGANKNMDLPDPADGPIVIDDPEIVDSLERKIKESRN